MMRFEKRNGKWYLVIEKEIRPGVFSVLEAEVPPEMIQDMQIMGAAA